jgi:ketosteroid isomerase-like protein
MKISFLITLAGLAISLAVPTFAQQKETVDPQIAEQLNGFGTKFDEVFNKDDAAAVADFYTKDVILVTPGGLVNGRQALEKWHTDLFQKARYTNRITKFDANSIRLIGAVGDGIWAAGQWSVTVQGQNGPPAQRAGYFSAVYVRDGDSLKIRMTTFNVTPPPMASSATTPSPTATPSKR